MKKALAKRPDDDLRPEYDLSKLKGGVRGKYYRQAKAGTNLVLIEPELMGVFPDTDSVNRALRVWADAAEVAARLLLAKIEARLPQLLLRTAEAAGGPRARPSRRPSAKTARQRFLLQSGSPTKRLKQTAGTRGA